MQRSITTAVSMLGKRSVRYGASFPGGSFRITDQCSMFSSESRETSQPSLGAASPSNSSKKPFAVSLSWSAPVEKKKVPMAQPTPALPDLSPAVVVVTPRVFPYIIKLKAASALRMKERARLKAIKDKAALTAKSLAAKLKASSDKEKAREETKVQAAKAKVQKAKAEVIQRKALHVKRAPTAYILFMTDQIKAVSHVAPAERFKRMSVLYKELTPEKRQAYADAAAKLKAESATRRAAVDAIRVQQYRPATAYLLFCQEKLPELKAADMSAKSGDLLKLLGMQWRALSDDKKQLLKARVLVRA